MRLDNKEIAKEVAIPPFFDDKHNTLVTLVVGNKPTTYCKFKTRELEKHNFRHKVILLNPFIRDNPESKKDMIMKILKLNEDKNVIGIMLELPVPETHSFLRDIINPKKDIDCITTHNLGSIMCRREPYFLPCTSLAVLHLINRFKATNVNGKEKFQDVLLIGNGNVANPLHQILLQRGYTVTQLPRGNSKPKYIMKKLRPDILISATGSDLGYLSVTSKTKLVIDIGSRLEDGKLKTDIDPSSYYSYNIMDIDYTSLPNGIGNITTKYLITNLILSYNRLFSK